MAYRPGTVSRCNLERRAVFGPSFPMVVGPRCRDVCVSKPLLELGDIRWVVKRVRRRRRPPSGLAVARINSKGIHL